MAFEDLKRHISAFYFRLETLGGLLQNKKKDEIFVPPTITSYFITTDDLKIYYQPLRGSLMESWL